MSDDPNISRDLGRVEGKIDLILASIHRVYENLANHEGRISTLEESHTERKGAFKVLAALAALTGGVIGALTSILGLHH